MPDFGLKVIMKFDGKPKDMVFYFEAEESYDENKRHVVHIIEWMMKEYIFKSIHIERWNVRKK